MNQIVEKLKREINGRDSRPKSIINKIVDEDLKMAKSIARIWLIELEENKNEYTKIEKQTKIDLTNKILNL